MNQRRIKILEILSREQKAEVAVLAELLGVSQVTIRKDLASLEEEGIIRREHGLALLCSPDDINGQMAYHYEAKLNIARKAAELVSDGDTVMIESGSCCALLAGELAERYKNLTILTNSAFIAKYIREKHNVQIVLFGGIYQPHTQVLVGPMIRQCAENFFVNYLFIGTDGWGEQIGFTNRDQMRAQAVRDMAGQAETVVVLAESEKFSKYGMVPLNLKERLKIAVSDQGLPQETRQILQAQGIDLLLAE